MRTILISQDSVHRPQPLSLCVCVYESDFCAVVVVVVVVVCVSVRVCVLQPSMGFEESNACKHAQMNEHILGNSNIQSTSLFFFHMWSADFKLVAAMVGLWHLEKEKKSSPHC